MSSLYFPRIKPDPPVLMASNQQVLVIGSGGREHAIVWKLVQSARIGKVFVYPGSAGIGLISTKVELVDNLTVTDFKVFNKC